MLPPIGQAIDALSAEVGGLLTASGASPAPQIRILANEPRPVGIGGFVSMHDDPQSEIFGRHLDAEVAVRVFGTTAVDLDAAFTQANQDLVRADPIQLRRIGILKLKILSERDAPLLQSEDGIPANFARDLIVSVGFEHKPVPTASQGTLDAVPVDVTQASLTEQGGLLYSSEFETDPLADFTALDRSGGSGSVGNWSYDATTQNVVQTGTTSGGNNGVAANKTGTYLTLNPGVAGTPANFVVQADVQCGPTGGIGFVFRFQDIDNFGFVVLESPANVRVIGKRIAGSGSFLDQGGQDSEAGFAPNTWFRLRFLADGDRFELALDETTVLSGRDSALISPGTVGFFCRRADTARFRHIRLSGL